MHPRITRAGVELSSRPTTGARAAAAHGGRVAHTSADQVLDDRPNDAANDAADDSRPNSLLHGASPSLVACIRGQGTQHLPKQIEGGHFFSLEGVGLVDVG